MTILPIIFLCSNVFIRPVWIMASIYVKQWKLVVVAETIIFGRDLRENLSRYKLPYRFFFKCWAWLPLWHGHRFNLRLKYQLTNLYIWWVWITLQHCQTVAMRCHFIRMVRLQDLVIWSTPRSRLILGQVYLSVCRPILDFLLTMFC